MDRFKSWYYSIFNALTTGVSFKNFEEVQTVHRFIFATLFTSLIMWSYALNTHLNFKETFMSYIGFGTAIVHLASLLIYRITKSAAIGTHIFLLCGFIFQVSYSYMTGGFFASTLIWVSILPLIAGIVLGKRGLLIWVVSALAAIAVLFSMGTQDNHISEFGQFWGQLNITVGYTILNTVLMFIFIHLENAQRKKIEDQNESIKKLLRVVGHDIANPLTVSLTSTDLLRRMIDAGKPPEELQKFVERINKSCLMITEILDNTRSLEIISTEKRQFKLENIYLNDIVENCWFIFEDKLKEKEITLNYDFHKNKAVRFKAEAISIKNEVFNNLFSNAIKFMEPGGDINIDVINMKGIVIVHFEDTGLGMDEKTQKNLFSSDVKTTTKGTKGEKGTGFGMPILYSTLAEIGATIEVKSIPKKLDPENHGTEFIIRFRK